MDMSNTDKLMMLISQLVFGAALYIPGMGVFIVTLMGKENVVPQDAFKVHFFYKLLGETGTRIYYCFLGLVFAIAGSFIGQAYGDFSLLLSLSTFSYVVIVAIILIIPFALVVFFPKRDADKSENEKETITTLDILQVDNGYKVGERFFSKKRDAEDYVTFIKSSFDLEEDTERDKETITSLDVLQVDSGYKVGERIFSERKDAEDYVTFIKSRFDMV